MRAYQVIVESCVTIIQMSASSRQNRRLSVLRQGCSGFVHPHSDVDRCSYLLFAIEFQTVARRDLGKFKMQNKKCSNQYSCSMSRLVLLLCVYTVIILCHTYSQNY